jgi:hypothetical protein
VYFHKNRSLEAIRLYRTFLQEINTELYEYPCFDRIIASLVHQIGAVGLYRLIVRRLTDVTAVDWQEVLRATGAGQMRIEPLPGEPADAELPPTVHEMQEGAKMVALIAYPGACTDVASGLSGLRSPCPRRVLNCERLAGCMGSVRPGSFGRGTRAGRRVPLDRG